MAQFELGGSGSASTPEYVKLAGSDANQRDSTYYGDGLTSGIMAVHERYFDGLPITVRQLPRQKSINLPPQMLFISVKPLLEQLLVRGHGRLKR